MSNELELVDDKPKALVALPMATGSKPGDLIVHAMNNGASMDQLERLYDLQVKYEANEARKAFAAAKAQFKAETIVVVRDKFNKQYSSQYSSLGNLVNTVTPYLSKHGLSADWSIAQANNQITVTCILSHSMGHSEQVEFTVPPDTAGAKNPIQAIKSSITYAKSVTYESVCGMASTDANCDDDGNESSAKKEPTRALPLLGQVKFERALNSVKDGSYTESEIRQYYQLTPEQELQLKALKNQTKG